MCVLPGYGRAAIEWLKRPSQANDKPPFSTPLRSSVPAPPTRGRSVRRGPIHFPRQAEPASWPARETMPRGRAKPCLARWGAWRGTAERGGQLAPDERFEIAPRPTVKVIDLGPMWIDDLRRQRLCHTPQVQAQAADAGVFRVRYFIIGGDAHQQLVQSQSFGPEDRQSLEGKSGDIPKFHGSGEIMEDVLRPKNGGERQQFASEFRADAWVPGTMDASSLSR